MKHCIKARKLTFVILGFSAISGSAMAQVPDLLNALDAGGRAMGTGGSLYSTGSDTLSPFYNPAGLGYISKGSIGLAYRNLPESNTKARDEFGNLELDSSGKRGKNTLSHLGLAFPLGDGKRGTIGVSYNIGGFIKDSRSDDGVLVGGNPVNFYREDIEAQSDYITVAYGKSSASQNFSWGFGLQYLRQRVADRAQLVDGGNNLLIDTDLDETGNGLGFIAGFQFIPKNNPNVSFGLSYRSEIDLNGNSETKELYDRVPARLLGGVAFRQDGMRGGRDFIVYGLQLQHFFAGENSQVFDRTAQTTAGFGLEYSYQTNGFRIPIRLGYNVVPGGGSDFGSRNGFAFGFGYRPNDNRYSFDLNFVSPENGGYDIGISVNYRFGN